METPEDIARRVKRCLRIRTRRPKLVFAPDCGLSQTARWAAKRKLTNLVAGVRLVRSQIGT
jgi:5-methyltetrahydropteroyltriglutamate--homocysteine methyltransferase